MRCKKKYSVKLVYHECENSGLTGYVQPELKEIFQPFDRFSGIVHDLFEHWFEGTDFFNAEKITLAGEYVAMGCREYLITNSNWFYGFWYYKNPNVNGLAYLENFLYDNYEQSVLKADERSFDYYPCFPEHPVKLKLFTGVKPGEISMFSRRFDLLIPESYKKKMNKKLNRYYQYGYQLADFMFNKRMKDLEDLIVKFETFYQFILSKGLRFDTIEFVNDTQMYIKFNDTLLLHPRKGSIELLKLDCLKILKKKEGL